MTEFSYQLYSSRNFPPLDDTLKMVAALGYTQVEGFGGLYPTPEAATELRGKLDASGLSMPTGHVGLDAIEADPQAAIATAKALGMTTVLVPHIAEEKRPSDAAGWTAFGQRIAEAGKPVMDAGFDYGWHNHAFEMERCGGDYVLDLILAGSDDLKAELDLAWIRIGGEKPVDWIEKYASRLVAVHLKDIAPKGEAADEDGWADVGHGTMDWPAINAALAGTAVKYRVMEHDNPNDHERFARRSIEAARNF